MGNSSLLKDTPVESYQIVQDGRQKTPPLNSVVMNRRIHEKIFIISNGF